MHDRQPADLFARLPGHFRIRDAENGRALEALMGLFRDELGIIEQDLDRLYDNWFIETCEPWAVPYIAGLVGARPMRDIGEDQAGLLRAYVANVLQYRQAKGTAAVVEQVARDVSGWPVVAVEFFQQVATSQNLNHLRRNALVFPDLRDAEAARTSRAPFSTMAKGAAAGAPDGWSGRYNLPHLGIFVWSRSAAPCWPVEDGADAYLGGAMASPVEGVAGLLRFDPLGRELPLVNRPLADLSITARMTERTVPGALRRRDLADALDAARAQGATTGRWFEDSPPLRVRLGGQDVPPAKLYCCNLEQREDGTFRRPSQAGEVLIDPVLGRLSLHADDEALPVETGFAQGAKFDVGGGAYDRRESLDRWMPDFAIAGEPAPWQIGVTRIAAHVTDDPDQGGPVVENMREAVRRWNEFAAATPGARGIIAVMDNATYDEAVNAARRVILPKGSRLAIVAAAWPAEDIGGGASKRTPGRLSPLHRRPCVTGPVNVHGLDAGDDDGGMLVIDGLVIRNKIQLRANADLGQLSLFNCTVGATAGQLKQALVQSTGNERVGVTIHRSIVGPLDLPVATGRLAITRSIVGEDRVADGSVPANPVVGAPSMDGEISGSTVFGRMSLRTIEAENSILLGLVTLRHRQSGCVRFCYTTRDSVLPRSYRCVPRASDSDSLRPVFVSTRFEDIGFAELRLSTPVAILEGAEDGMEMGMGFANRDPARRANIKDVILEFAPFGLLPGIIFVS